MSILVFMCNLCAMRQGLVTWPWEYLYQWSALAPHWLQCLHRMSHVLTQAGGLKTSCMQQTAVCTLMLELFQHCLPRFCTRCCGLITAEGRQAPACMLSA